MGTEITEKTVHLLTAVECAPVGNRPTHQSIPAVDSRQQTDKTAAELRQPQKTLWFEDEYC